MTEHNTEPDRGPHTGAGTQPHAEPRIAGLNHVTLAVADLDRSLAFYRGVLGCDLRASWDGGAYLEAGALWLCLSLDPKAGRALREDYTHLAFDVCPEVFDALAAKVRAVAPLWRENRSEGASVYMLDPDGHRLELHVGSLASRIAHCRRHPPPGWTLAGEGTRAAGAPAYVVMGVSGCGKSTVGRALAARLHLAFRDGDELHPVANIAKMARGEALSDADRLPWLRAVAAELRPGTVMACSALRRSYRDLLRAGAPAGLIFVHLDGPRETLLERMRQREGHFMPVTLLDSQLATLEPLGADERHVTAPIEAGVPQIVRAILAGLERVGAGQVG